MNSSISANIPNELHKSAFALRLENKHTTRTSANAWRDVHDLANPAHNILSHANESKS